MKSMLWKELRENLKWAALGFLALLLAEFFVISSQRPSSSEGITLCNPTFLLVTAFGCSLVGAALGILQILPELRRDQWASLLHRPVPRGVIFLGKAVAGLLLCVVATTLPLLITIGYVAIPGRFAAPLFPGLTLPAFSDILLGPVFYAAALLACLHRGKWYGSRGAIVLAAVAVLILHLVAGWPFLLPILATAMFLVAAWGALLSNGTVRGRPMVSRVAFVVIILAGSSTALLLLGSALQWAPWFKARPAFEYSNFRIARDGHVFLQIQRADGVQELIDAVDGKVITDERYTNADGNNFLYSYPIAWKVGDKTNIRDYLRGRPRAQANYLMPLDRNYEAKELWLLLVEQNYLIGYDKLSRRCVGIFDREGFKPPGAEPKPFPQLPVLSFQQNMKGDQLFWVGSRAYLLETSDRKLTPLFDAKNESISGGIFFPYSRTKDQGVALALDSEIRILNRDGTPRVSIPYHYDIAKFPSIEGTATDNLDHIFIQYAPAWSWNNTEEEFSKRTIHLDQLDAQGKVVRSFSRAAQDVHKAPRTWSGWFVTETAPLLPSAASVAYWKMQRKKDSDFPMIPGTYSYIAVSDLVPLLAIAIVLGIVAWLWARQAGFKGGPAWRWALFVFCFGLPGLMTFRMAANWPARVPCPKCGRQRSIERGDCSSCHAAWPATPSNGTEIFDGAEFAELKL